MGATDSIRAISADPAFQDATLRALRGDMSSVLAMSDDHQWVAARSMTLVIANRVLETEPCNLAGVTFWVADNTLTFTTDADLLTVTAARMIAVDATSFTRGDHGESTHMLWLSLLEAVPAKVRRQLTALIAGKFTTSPEPVDLNRRGGPHV